MRVSLEEKALKVIALAHVLGGVILVLLYFIPSVHPLMLSHLYSAERFNADAQQQIAFWFFLFGPTVASWGLLFYSQIHHYFLTGDDQLWRQLIAAVLLWAVLDTSLCFYNGVWFWVLGNSIVALTMVFLLVSAKLFKSIRNSNLLLSLDGSCSLPSSNEVDSDSEEVSFGLP